MGLFSLLVREGESGEKGRGLKPQKWVSHPKGQPPLFFATGRARDTPPTVEDWGSMFLLLFGSRQTPNDPSKAVYQKRGASFLRSLRKD
jgi:hypothetical protein